LEIEWLAWYCAAAPPPAPEAAGVDDLALHRLRGVGAAVHLDVLLDVGVDEGVDDVLRLLRAVAAPGDLDDVGALDELDLDLAVQPVDGVLARRDLRLEPGPGEQRLEGAARGAGQPARRLGTIGVAFLVEMLRVDHGRQHRTAQEDLHLAADVFHADLRNGVAVLLGRHERLLPARRQQERGGPR
jgi:hypothetical protein